MEKGIIAVASATESKTNPRGKEFSGPGFDELVKSIKELGVLVPVLARKVGKGYEVIAGSRRLRAAKKAGLKEIPANIVEMTDEEAREAQIVENLQREDIHPLDEGKAYRELMEKTEYKNHPDSIPVIAARVGKDVKYVKARLVLTNLEAKVADGYRAGKINDGHAVIIAQISPADQLTAFKECGSRYGNMGIQQLKDWVDDHIYKNLNFQPWLKTPELMEAVGKCKECPPNGNSLFGAVKEGACTDTRCWTRKMAAYVALWVKESGFIRVTKEWGAHKGGVLGRDDYKTLSSKPKEHCDFAKQAIVSEGDDMGTMLWICADKECKEHYSQHSATRMTGAEKKARQKELKLAKAKKEKEDKALDDTLKKIKWPLKTKQLGSLLNMVIAGSGSTITRDIVKRRGLEPKVTKHGGDYAYTSRDYEAPLFELAKTMDDNGKTSLLIELLSHRIWEEKRQEYLKQF